MSSSVKHWRDVDWDACWWPEDPAARKRLERSRRRALTESRQARAAYLLDLRGLRGRTIVDARPITGEDGEEGVLLAFDDGGELALPGAAQ